MTVNIRVPLLDLQRLHVSVADRLEAAVLRVVRSGRYVLGAEVEAWEQELAAYLQVGHCVAVKSGTDALLAALMAVGLRPGDEVIVPSYTFGATAQAVVRAGGVPVFVDVEPDGFTMDPDAAAAAVTARTAGMIPVHLFGQCADMDRLGAVARRHGLFVLEDAAQALGARLAGRFAGTMGTMGALSFFPAKNLGALGDGGAVVTDDGVLAATLRAVRTHGAARKYHYEIIGGNLRMDALQAAALRVKLPCLDDWNRARRRLAAAYDAALAGVPEVATPRPVRGEHVYNQYVVQVEARDRLQQHLARCGVASAVYYPEPLHVQPCFADRSVVHPCPVSARLCSRALALPVDPLMTEEQRRLVVSAVRSFFEVSP